MPLSMHAPAEGVGERQGGSSHAEKMISAYTIGLGGIAYDLEVWVEMDMDGESV